MEKIDINNIASISQDNKLFYCVKSLDNNDWLPILVCQPSYDRTIIIDGVEYIDDRYITIMSDASICSILPKGSLSGVINDAITFITSKGRLVDIPEEDFYLHQYLDALDEVPLVKDVTKLSCDGEIPLDDEIMQKLCIEAPVRKACINLSKNGIKTLMSSANVENILSRDIKVDESRVYIGQNEPWVIGNGYAWIMLDWDQLSDENKSYLISIRNDDLELDLSEKENINLRYLSELNGKKKSQDQLIKFYEYVDIPKEEVALFGFDSTMVVDKMQLSLLPRDNFYDSNKVYLLGHNSLNNHLQNGSNHFRTVVIRYPMDEFTTVDDVENFYNKISLNMIKNQNNRIGDGKTSK